MRAHGAYPCRDALCEECVFERPRLPRPTPAALIAAMRVPEAVSRRLAGDDWQEGITRGVWRFRRVGAVEMAGGVDFIAALGRLLGGFGSYTLLERASLRTLHTDRPEVVMEDSAQELRRHLPIVLRAHGRVLVTGLGLGCVLRGLLAQPHVEHVTVVEIDRTIINAVWPEFAGNPRVRLVHGDAERVPFTGDVFDFAWHDVWTDGDEHLDCLHMRLLARFAPYMRDDRIARQGAWQMHRPIKRACPIPLVNAKRRRLLAERRAP